MIEDREYVRTLLEFDPSAAARQLITLANERGTTDNVSAVVVEALPTRVQAQILQQAPARRGGPTTSQIVILVMAVAVIIVIVILLAAMGALPFL